MLPTRYSRQHDSASLPNFAVAPVPGIRDVATGLLRHVLLILVCAALFVGLGVLYTRYSPPVYQATALLRFEAERVNVPQLVEMLATDKTVSTEVEVMKGRAAAVPVIDSLALRARLTKPRDARITSVFAWLRVPQSADSGTLVFRSRGDGRFDIARSETAAILATAGIGDTAHVADIAFVLGGAAAGLQTFTVRIDPLEVAVERLASSLSIAAPSRDVDLIAVRARSADPNQAAAIANMLARSAIADRQSFRSGRTDAAVVFLESQSDSLGRQLRATEDSLRAYQQREHVIDVPQQGREEVTRLAGLRANIAGLRAERDAVASLVDQLRRDGVGSDLGGQAAARRLAGFPALLSSPSASVLLNALAQVENERSQLLIRRTPNDRDVMALTERARSIEAQLRGIAQSYLQGLDDQVSALERESQRFQNQLDALPAKALETARLERNAKVLNDLWVLVQTRLKEAQAAGIARDPAMRMADTAVAPTRPIRPVLLKNVAVALVLGLSAGIVAALLLELNDRSVRSRNDAERVTGLPVLSALPRIHAGKAKAMRWLPSGESRRTLASGGRGANRVALSTGPHLVGHPQTPVSYTESLNQLFASLAWGQLDPRPRTLVFTSPLPGEGKTLTAVNFALLGASRGLNVLLIDGDLRCGDVAKRLGVRSTPGLSELLQRSATDEEVVRSVPVHDNGTLSVVTSGTLPKMPGAVITQERVRDVLSRLVPKYDLVVIDSPPVNLLADAGVLGSAADAVLLVVRAGYTKADDLQYAMDQLAGMRATVVGTLLNDIDLRRRSYDDGSYRYLAEAARYG